MKTVAPRALSPACSKARTSACLIPSKVWEPSPITRPSLSTTTAPTQGLGEVKPILLRASSSARRRKYSSFSRLDEPGGAGVEDFRGVFRLSRFTDFLDVIGSFWAQ